ncbi:ATP-binding cassette domain-containing protein, partial [Vibrio parahaemolyticus]|nr:ATP-binding cassette domain-containing protein [Vibrio parahaemolyticus]
AERAAARRRARRGAARGRGRAPAGRAGKKLAAYSGGMKQRLLAAAALLGSPQLLILDEPTAGLDPKERVRLRHILQQLSHNCIVLVATHVVP